MLKKKLIAVIGGMALSLSIVGTALAAPNSDNSSETNKQLTQVRQATEKYHDFKVALQNGYINTEEVAVSPEGVMGIHFVNPALMFDGGVLNQNQPEVLLYNPSNDGGYKLVGVEYYVPAFMTNEHPALFGHPFDGSMLNHDLDPTKLTGAEIQNPLNRHYDLHVWLWHANPAGIFAPWNPSIKIK
ncbi:hypothetical protein [Neobacillus bataviensis]|uniref:hypothetical protein n=1 Tax=Neobacillus bataviensis TaxID=220685 RepID=UPI001CBC2560|nr:hypothetical protein [Neobacillus bataviensis]